MPSVEEILKASGLSVEEIKALDAKVLTGVTQVLTTANAAEQSAIAEREKAELAQRATNQKWADEISPALDSWANDKASLEARELYYKTLAEKAKEGGFLPGNEPFKPPSPEGRDASGKFVANQNPVPGSPQFVDGLRNELGTAFSFATDVQWKYQTLFGKMIPDSPTQLIREAVAQHLPPMEYAAKKYGFAEKEASIQKETHDKEIAQVRAEAIAETDKKWAERTGGNPDVRRAEVSRFSEINKAVKEGTRPDPLKMTEKDRDASTTRAIRQEIAVQQTGAA